MSGKRFVSFTDEVPRSSSPDLISALYKAWPKGECYAPAAETAAPWLRSWGCLQRQSMSSAADDRKAKPQSDSSVSFSSRNKLASAKKRSLTAERPLRTVPPQGEPSWPCRRHSPFLGTALSYQGIVGSRLWSGSPGAGNPLAGQYGEWTPLRQRGGAGFDLPLTH